MPRFPSRQISFALLACGTLWMTGCAGPRGKINWAFWEKPPTRIPGLKTPQERIEELAQLTDQAARQTSAEQARLADELAQEIQREQDVQVRRQIIRTLAVIPNERAAAVIHAGLDDPDESVRIACCEAWGKRGGSLAIEELSTALETQSSVDVRIAAAKALGELNDPAAVQPLAQLLVENDPAIQRRAMESLKYASGKDYGYDVQAWRQYAQGQPVEQKSVGIAELWKRWF
jgi:HEAT repeat protein